MEAYIGKFECQELYSDKADTAYQTKCKRGTKYITVRNQKMEQTEKSHVTANNWVFMRTYKRMLTSADFKTILFTN